MINTHHSSLAPPPVPPRYRGHHQEPMPRRPYLRILMIVFILHVLVTSGMFVYLFRRNTRATDHEDSATVSKMIQDCEDNGQDYKSQLDCIKASNKFSKGTPKVSQREESGFEMTAVAHLLVDEMASNNSKYLNWKKADSTVKNIGYDSSQGMVEIRHPGYYYIYSKVTFSKPLHSGPLMQSIVRQMQKLEVLQESYCDMAGGLLCTSFQGGIFFLQKGQKLGVRVTEMSHVHFNTAATTFGLFLLRNAS